MEVGNISEPIPDIDYSSRVEISGDNKLQIAASYPFEAGQSDTDWLPTWSNPFLQLSLNERRRRLLHILPGLLPLVWIMRPHDDRLSAGWQCAFVTTAAIVGTLACYCAPAIARDGEEHCWHSPVSYACVGIAPIILFPARPELGAASLAVLAFGDGSAALGGMLLRGPTLPWNSDKTWAGLFCFLGASIPIATFYIWAETQPAIAPPIALFCASCAAAAGVLAESVPSKINDNLRVGVAALITLLAVEWFVFGWR